MSNGAVPNTVEYNKVHALARARKLVVQKFGGGLMHFWPMVDGSREIRDLLRRRGLLASAGVALQQPGLLDYALSPGTGYVADVSASQGGTNYQSTYLGSQYWDLLVKMPAGVYDSIEIVTYGNQWNTYSSLYITPWQTPNPWNDRVREADYEEATNLGSYYWKRTWRFPTPFYAGSNEYAFGLHVTDPYYVRGVPANGDQGVGVFYNSSWNSIGVYAPVRFVGRMAKTWPAMGKLTVGIVVNAEQASPGVLFALSNASEAKVKLELDTSFKVKGYIKNVASATYTLTTPEKLHSGFNLVTLSYEPGIAVKLAANGQVEASATPGPDNAIASQALAVGIGAQVTTGVGVSSKVGDAVLDDAFVASAVVSDADLWDIFVAYITAAPLMQVEDVTPV